MTTVEILEFPPSLKYAKDKTKDLPSQLFAGLAKTARDWEITVRFTKKYEGKSDWLMLYGPGGPDRQVPMLTHTASGRRVICWDAPYWGRGEKLRVSIDSAHPQHWVMRRQWSEDRLRIDHAQSKISMGAMDAYWDPSGPILIAGIGAKASVQYGRDTVRAWERNVVIQSRLLFGDRRVAYRPKPNHPTVPPEGAVLWDARRPIEADLKGLSLVATWHSNVAVDAILHGVPVVCREGAAAAVCPATLSLHQQPLPATRRLAFLSNLAWFQWAPHEARDAWHFLRCLLSPHLSPREHACSP